MKTYFADLHIHIGRTNTNKPVKITGAKNLTIDNIFYEASEHKGMDIIGVIDCHVPEIIESLEKDIMNGVLTEHSNGGIQFQNTTLFLGSELEIYDEHCQGPIHVLIFLPTLEDMQAFSMWCKQYVKNINLSSQRIYTKGKILQNKVKELDGLFIPAHIFTPFKSLYGKGVHKSLTEVFTPDLIDAVELGLSSDTEMASQLKELNPYPFLTNSDAHSLQNIGREYQKLQLTEPSFLEFKKALKKEQGRKIVANYGLNPRLGKYYETFCDICETTIGDFDEKCPHCKGKKVIKGVKNRLEELMDQPVSLQGRPQYIHQIPLPFIPGIGKRTLEKLREHFGTEMNILHHVSYKKLCEVVPEKIAKLIVVQRKGKLSIRAGGGGVYGKVEL